MEILETTVLGYFFPSQPLLMLVIFGIWVVGFIVARKIHNLRQIAKVNLQALDNTADVSTLERSLKNPRALHDDDFTSYANEKGIEPRTEILFDHINTIFKAGVKGSNLEPELLVQNTVSKMFDGVDSLKTSVSMFLVIGILGTLLGLAISIGTFSGGNFLTNQEVTATADQLTSLFKNLRGAFAPSMWGVASTILFVFIYTFRVQEGCINKVTEKLTLNTIQYWLPTLYPTDFQRGDNSIAKLNATIKNADGINKGVIDLQDNLKASNETIRALSKMSRQVELATTHFEVGTNRIGEIQKIYDDLRKCNDAFNESIETITTTAETASRESYSKYLAFAQEQAQTLQEKVNQLTEQMNVYFTQLTEAMRAQTTGLSAESQSQQQKLEAIIAELQKYNEGIIISVNKLMEVANQTIKNSNSANETLQKSAQLFMSSKDDMVAALGGPIVNSLEQMMKDMNARLDSMTAALNRMGNPLNKAVDNMNRIFNTMLKNMQAQADRMESISKGLLAGGNGKNIDPKVLKSILTQPQANSISTMEIEQGLRAILQQLKRMETKPEESETGSEPAPEPPKSFWQKFTPPTAAISILLLLSLILQVVMVLNLSALK